MAKDLLRGVLDKLDIIISNEDIPTTELKALRYGLHKAIQENDIKLKSLQNTRLRQYRLKPNQ